MARSLNVQLKHNQEYQATFKLVGFEQLATNQQVASKLTELGFTKVAVQGSGANRTAKGVWSLPSQLVQTPSQVTHVCEAVKSLG